MSDRFPCPYSCEYPGCELGAHKPKVNWNGDDTVILCTTHIKSEIIDPLLEEVAAANLRVNYGALDLMRSLSINPIIPEGIRTMMKETLDH